MTRGKRESLAYVLFFEIGKIGKQLLNSAACRQRFHDHSNGHTQATDAWLTAHHFGIDGDSVERLHMLMIPQSFHVACRIWLVEVDRLKHPELVLG